MTVAEQEKAFYVVAPDRSLAQRMEALAFANEVRVRNAALKRDLKAGRKGLIDALEDERHANMRVFDVLMALPKYGRVKAVKVLRECRISPSKTLGGLTRRQQNELVSMLGDRAWPSAPGLSRAV